MDGHYGVDSPGYQSPSPVYGGNPASPGYAVAGYK